MSKQFEKCIIIVRVSHPSQEEEGYSLDAQQEYLVNYAEKNYLKPAREPYRIAESASGKKKREIFMSAMSYVTANDIKHIIFEKIDRATRNHKDQVMLDDWMEEDAERRIHFVKNSLKLHRSSRSQDKLQWGIGVVFAKNTIDNLREEVAKGVIQKLKQGWLPSKAKLGYKTIGDEGKRIHVIDEATAPLVRKIFELYLEPNHSINSVTAQMKRLGLKTSNGRFLVASHVAKILRDPFYAGKLVWVGKDHGKGQHEPLIPPDVFEAVQRKLDGKNIPKYQKHDHLFRGMFRCSDCDGQITWEVQKGHVYGHCNGYRNCPKKKWVRQDVVEEELTTVFDQLKDPSEGITEWVVAMLKKRHAQDIEVYNATLNQLRSHQDKLKDKLDTLYDDRLEGRITPERYDQKVIELEGEEVETNKAIEKLQNNNVANLEAGLDILELSKRAAEIYKSKKLPEQRRALMAEIFSNLTLKGDIIGYEYTEMVAAVAEKKKATRELEYKFEPADFGSWKVNNAFVEQLKTIWLGR